MGPLIDHRAPGSFAETLRLDPEAWAIRISARWRMGVESIISTGRLLNEAKAALPHGGFGAVLAQLPFGERQAQMLMAIANHPIASNPQYVALLPPSWGTIYDCTRLPIAEFERGVAQGIIRPDMERNDIERLRARPVTISDGQGSPVEDNPVDLTASSLQQELDTTNTHGTAAETSRGELRDVGNVANPEDQPASAPPVPPGPSEAIMPGGGLAIAHSRVEPTDSLDFFPTPPWATRALFEHVFVHLNRKGHCQFQRAWEPACGEGHMAEVMCEYFRDVMASDKGDYAYRHYGIDFLTDDTVAPGTYDWIITNPPFGENTDKFILKALELAGTGVAMLVRLQCLETVGRYEKIFRDRPPTLISFFVERVPMHKGRWEPDGDTMTAYIWLTWLKGASPQAPFWIPPGCREALTKPDDVARFGTRSEAAA